MTCHTRHNHGTMCHARNDHGTMCHTHNDHGMMCHSSYESVQRALLVINEDRMQI